MRRVVRVCVWGLGSVLALAAGLLLLNSFDEPLRPEVRAALEPPAEPYVPGRNLLYALMGFGSPEADFEAAGRRLEQTLLQADSPGNPLKVRLGDLDQPHLDRAEWSALPPLGDLAASFAAWHGPRGANILSGNRVLMQRYEALRRYPFYARVLPSRLPMSMQPDWEYPIGAVRVRQVWFAQLLESGQAATVVHELRADAAIWRRVLSAAQMSQMDKSLATRLLRADFAIAGAVVRRYPLQAADYAALRELAAPVTDADRSLAGIVANELRQSHAGSSFFAESEYSLDDNDRGHAWQVLLYRRFFLQNATDNLHYRILQQVLAREGGSCRDLGARAPLDTDGVWQWLAPYNPWGRYELLSPMWNYQAGRYESTFALYDRITNRLCDLQGFQRLLALQVLLRQRPVEDAQVPEFLSGAGPEYADPFTGAPMRWDAQSKTLGFAAMDEADRALLPWGI